MRENKRMDPDDTTVKRVCFILHLAGTKDYMKLFASFSHCIEYHQHCNTVAHPLSMFSVRIKGILRQKYFNVCQRITHNKLLLSGQ